jgi:hypothetical protein
MDRSADERPTVGQQVSDCNLLPGLDDRFAHRTEVLEQGNPDFLWRRQDLDRRLLTQGLLLRRMDTAPKGRAAGCKGV